MKLYQIRFIFRRIASPKKQKIKKIELWERDLSAYQRFKVNARIKWRRFDTQTRGLGLLMVLFMSIMITVSLIPIAFNGALRQIEEARYSSALHNACNDRDFYNLNFKSCETVGVRPNASAT